MSLLRRTKIVATIGPATNTDKMIKAMILAGMNVARLNMSHTTHDQVRETVDRIRQISKELGRTVGILMDTQGPAIRTGNLQTDLDLVPGQIVALTVRGEMSEEYHSIDVNYDDLVNDINVGDVVIVDNGNIQLKVLKKHANQLDCEVLTEGVLGSRRHINLPGVRVNLPSITQKDVRDIECGIEIGVDFFAMSFVREAQDVMKLRGILDYKNAPQKIIAKLEDQLGVKNLIEILDVTDGIMVARGDLGIEVSYEEMPVIQRRIVKKAQIVGKPVIVATHMLESMIDNPLPSRAEVTDVANAVYEQADAIMLSGETSVGKYPVQCIEVMDNIARRTERSGGVGYHELAKLDSAGAKLSKAACELAKNLPARAIVVFTRRGSMARNIAWPRPLHTPIYAFTNDPVVLNKLTLTWGVRPFLLDLNDDANENINNAGRILVKQSLVKQGEPVVFITEINVRGKKVDTIQVEEF